VRFCLGPTVVKDKIQEDSLEVRSITKKKLYVTGEVKKASTAPSFDTRSRSKDEE